MAQLVGHNSVHYRKVAHCFQVGHMPRLDPRWHVCGRQPIDVAHGCFSPSLFLSRNQKKKIFKKITIIIPNIMRFSEGLCEFVGVQDIHMA